MEMIKRLNFIMCGRDLLFLIMEEKQINTFNYYFKTLYTAYKNLSEVARTKECRERCKLYTAMKHASGGYFQWRDILCEDFYS